VVGKRANQNKGSNQGKDKSCADYVKSYVRGFITVYIAWLLGVDAEDGFWTTYFKPLERLWTINRAQKDISLMRGEGLVDKDRLRLTEEGWGCMEEAIARFLKGNFGEHQNINIIKEYPVTTLVAPGFAHEYGIDMLDAVEPIKEEVKKYNKEMNKDAVIIHRGKPDPVSIIKELSGIKELEYRDPRFMRVRIAVGTAIRALVKGENYSDEVETLPSRWLIPIVPYLINTGFKHDLDYDYHSSTSGEPVLTFTTENISIVFRFLKN
jgi:uncharacterized protein YecA (UPF0149 family)